MPWSTTGVTSQPKARSRSWRSVRARSSATLNERWSNCAFRNRSGIPAGAENVSAPFTSKKAMVFSGPISKK